MQNDEEAIPGDIQRHDDAKVAGNLEFISRVFDMVKMFNGSHNGRLYGLDDGLSTWGAVISQDARTIIREAVTSEPMMLCSNGSHARVEYLKHCDIAKQTADSNSECTIKFKEKLPAELLLEDEKDLSECRCNLSTGGPCIYDEKSRKELVGRKVITINESKSVPFDLVVTEKEISADGKIVVHRDKHEILPPMSEDFIYNFGKEGTVPVSTSETTAKTCIPVEYSLQCSEPPCPTIREKQIQRTSERYVAADVEAEMKDVLAMKSRSMMFDEDDYAIIPDNVLIEALSQVNHPFEGPRDMETPVKGGMEADGGGPLHVHGPVDGNPYATIDHSLKDNHSSSNPSTDKAYNLTRGIEDLEDLLCDLGPVSPPRIDINHQESYSHVNSGTQNSCANGSARSISEIEVISGSDALSNKPHSSTEGSIPGKQVTAFTHYTPSVTHHTASVTYNTSNVTHHTSCVTDSTSSVKNEYPKSPTSSDVFKEPRFPLMSKDLLYMNDKSPRSERKVQWKQKVHSTSSGYNYNDELALAIHGNRLVKDTMTIQPGSVADKVRNLQKLFEQPSTSGGPKMGVPLAGLVSPEEFRETLEKYSNHDQIQYDLYTKEELDRVRGKRVDINFPGDSGEKLSVVDYSKNAGVSPRQNIELLNGVDHDGESKRSTLMSRSDSAYGESMRSSSSSSAVTPSPRIEQPFISTNGNLITVQKEVSSIESCSPKSDGGNEVSSGIASRSSSMTSESSFVDGNNQIRSERNITTSTSTPKVANGSCPINSAESTIPSASRSLPVNESEISCITITDTHEANQMNMSMDSYSTPRGILKTVDMRPHQQQLSPEVFRDKGRPLFLTPDSPSSPRFADISISTESSPDADCGVHLVDTPVFPPRKLSRGSSTGSEGPHSPRSTGSGGRQSLRRFRSRLGSGSSNSSMSSAELFHEVARYPLAHFDKETMHLWYKPRITREEATSYLFDKAPGTFVVRDSQSFEGAFGLAVKVETPPIGVLQLAGGDLTKIDLSNELVRHFLIEPCDKGVRLKGSSSETPFPSLVALIYQHSLTRMSLPVELVIPVPENEDNRSTLTEAQILEKGACCNLVYMGGVDVESLTGDGAVHYAMNKVTAQNMQSKSTTINIKVNHKGITLTDNQRKMFFRHHYLMTNVIHCGIDPKGRKINLKTLVENCDREVECFGFVVRKETSTIGKSSRNECHICSEMDPNQPASAVINFIHKAMRYSRT